MHHKIKTALAPTCQVQFLNNLNFAQKTIHNLSAGSSSSSVEAKWGLYNWSHFFRILLFLRVFSFFYFFAGNGFRNHFEDDRASVDRRTFEKPDESFETIFELFLNEVSWSRSSLISIRTHHFLGLVKVDHLYWY